MTTRSRQAGEQSKSVEDITLPDDETTAPPIEPKEQTVVVMPPLDEKKVAAEKPAPQVDTAREVFVMSFGGPAFQDFSPRPISADADADSVSGIVLEDEESEDEGEDPDDVVDPKDSSAQERADSSESTTLSDQGPF